MHSKIALNKILNGKKTSLDRKKEVVKRPKRMLLAVNFLQYRKHLPISKKISAMSWVTITRAPILYVPWKYDNDIRTRVAM